MIIVASGAKTFRTCLNGNSLPIFIDDACCIMDKLVLEDFKSYFKVSDKLAVKLKKSADNWLKQGRYCVLDTFYGLQFKQIDSINLTLSQREYAYKHLYVLSGLYGILKASDSICEYRLDGYDKIDGISMNEYYYEKVNNYLNSLDDEILNICSDEFSEMLDSKYPKVKFLVNNKSKGTINKIQRGKMIKYCIDNNINSIQEIKNYNIDGFKFNDELSHDNLLIFCKEEI